HDARHVAPGLSTGPVRTARLLLRQARWRRIGTHCPYDAMLVPACGVLAADVSAAYRSYVSAALEKPGAAEKNVAVEKCAKRSPPSAVQGPASHRGCQRRGFEFVQPIRLVEPGDQPQRQR